MFGCSPTAPPMLRVAALALLASAGARAQEFAPGYVVVEGDTLRGEVSLRNESRNAFEVRFRPSAAADDETFTPATATAFGADGGRQYRRGRFERAYDAAEAVSDAVTLFARVSRDGAADLLALETTDGAPLFFVQTDGAPVGLYVARVRVPSRGGIQTRERRLYLEALQRALGTGCGVLVTGETAYTERDLARVVDAYNACVDPAYVALERGARPVRRRFGVTSVTVGVDVIRGAFRRRVPRTIADPDLSALRASAAIEVESPFLPRALRLLAGAEFDYGLARVVRPQLGGGRQINVAYGRLGVRVLTGTGPVRLVVGTGFVSGVSVKSSFKLDDYVGVLRAVDSRELQSNLGGYVELGAGLRAFPVDFVVRGQQTRFGAGVQTPLPLNSGWRYGTRTVSVGLVGRL